MSVSSNERGSSDLSVNDITLNLKSLTLDESACMKLAEKENIQPVISLVMKGFDSESVSKSESSNCLDMLINIASFDTCCEKLASAGITGSNSKHELMWMLLSRTLSCSDRVWTENCVNLILNLTRYNFDVEFLISQEHVYTVCILCQVAASQVASTVEPGEAVGILANLCQDLKVGRILMEKYTWWPRMYNIFCSNIDKKWNSGALAIIKNIIHSSNEFHLKIIDNMDAFSLALVSLMTPHTLKYPMSLPHCPFKLTHAEINPVDYLYFREMSLQILFLLCKTSFGRERLRSLDVYTILKSLALADISDEESEICLDIIGILLRTEEEIGVDNLGNVDIPPEILRKFTEDQNQ